MDSPLQRARSARKALRRIRHRPRWGNLRRLEPLSDRFGYDRGTPIDRWYTARFLVAHADAIRGIVGEVAEATCARVYGGEAVERVEVIDLDPTNTAATLVADLTDPDALPADRFNCMLLMQTLQYLPDPLRSLQGIGRSVRPGGCLLLAAPALTPHDAKEADGGDYWRFWPAGLESLIRRALPGATCTINAYGNVLAATAYLYGLSAEELRDDELAYHDPRYPVVVCARVDLPSERAG